MQFVLSVESSSLLLQNIYRDNIKNPDARSYTFLQLTPDDHPVFIFTVSVDLYMYKVCHRNEYNTNNNQHSTKTNKNTFERSGLNNFDTTVPELTNSFCSGIKDSELIFI